jgi:hypothetical protein
MRCLHGTPRRCRKRIRHRTGREVAQKAASGLPRLGTSTRHPAVNGASEVGEEEHQTDSQDDPTEDCRLPEQAHEGHSDEPDSRPKQ